MDNNTLLVVVDMQNDFVIGPLGSDAAKAIVPKVAQKIAEAQHVMFTMDTHGENYLNTQEGKKLPVPHCIYGTDGHAVVDGLIDCCISKPSFIYKETFGSIQLAEQTRVMYQKGQIKRVELVGVCTDICVISNALTIKAFCPEIPISVDAACCAGVTPMSHKNALVAMKACQIEVENEVEDDD